MTTPDFLAALLLTAKGLLAIASICFLLSGCDDAFVDLYHLCRIIRARLARLSPETRAARPAGTRPSDARPTDASPMDLARICAEPEHPIAVMIPAWDESAVIRRMLLANLERIQYERLHVFVGMYPNDPATRDEVEVVRERHPNVHAILCPHDGPTNKADCLNRLYEGILAFERECDLRFEIFALNDSEDVIHPLCFKVFNSCIPDCDMVQLPVIPLERPWWHFTSGHYLDEFAENHGKDMVVRASLTGAVPAAGVGCAFSRRALDLAAATNGGELFSLDSLAEDYDLGMRLGVHGLKQAFVSVLAPREPVAATGGRAASAHRFGAPYRSGDPIGIREYFPSSVKAAVRQKARWIVGIAFQGWRRLGWRGSWAVKYALFRDRKGLVTNPTVALGYIVVLAVVTIWTLQWWDPEFYRFPPIVERGSWLWYVTIVNTCFLCLRLGQRCRFVWQVHGWRQALLSVPRQVWGNLVNVAAVSRACYLFARSLATGRAVAWDKTRHQFPSDAALPASSRRLGELLLDRRLMTVEQLEIALAQQRTQPGLLGARLQELGFIREPDLASALADQAALRRQAPLGVRAAGASGLHSTAAVFVLAMALTSLAGAAPRPADSPGRRNGSGLTSEFRRFRVYPRLDRAYRLIKANQLPSAQDDLEACLALDRSDVEVWTTYFDVLSRLEKFDLMLQRFEEAGELRDNARLRRYHALAALERHELNGVVADLRVLAGPATSGAASTVTVTGLDALASRFVDRASADRQADALAALLAIPPDGVLPPSVIVRAANALRDLGRTTEAKTAYARVAANERAGRLRLDADRALGDVALAQHAWAEAIRWYREWLTLDSNGSRPDTSSSRTPARGADRYQVAMALGRAYLELAQPHHAAEAFQIAVRMALMRPTARQKAIEALDAAADALQRAGRLAPALTDLRMALRLGPTGERHARVGLLLARLERQKEALPHLERAAHSGVPDDLVPTLFGQLGYIYAALDQPQAAIGAFLKALPHAPDPAAIYRALGYASFALGDDDSAIDQFEQSLALRDDPQTARSLALACARAGRDAQAAGTAARLRRMPGGEPLVNADLLNSVADAAFRRAHFEAAATLFQEAAAQAGPANGSIRAAALTRAAESLERAGAPAHAAEAVGIWDELAADDTVPREIRRTTAERAGYTHLRLNQLDPAAASFGLAIQLGSDGWRLRLDRALTLTKLARWSEALTEATASLAISDSARGHVVAAACFEKLDKPGLAVYHLTRSLEAGRRAGNSGDLRSARASEADGGLPPSERKYVLDELTSLYEREANDEAASQSARASLTLSPDPGTALHLAQLERRLGRNESARAVLNAIDPGASSPAALRVAVLDEQAAVHLALGDSARALHTIQQAVALAPSASRFFQLGQLARDSGDLPQAITCLRRSLDGEPDNVRYREALGYVSLQAGQLGQAVDLLRRVAQDEPDNVQVQQDLADALLRLGDQRAAVRQLRQAIVHIREKDATAEQRTLESLAARIGKTYETSAYFGYHTLATPNFALDRAGRPTLLSQSGIDVSRYLTGSQRGWSAVARLMSVSDGRVEASASQATASQTTATQTTATLNQLALGIRYKPFTAANFNLSAERVFQLGSGLPSSWLLRALYSTERGASVAADRRWHPYSSFYGDMAGFLGAYPSLLAYGETRYGVSRRLSDTWLVRPHATAAARHLIGGNGDALQLGAGVGVLHEFKDGSGGRRSSLEVRMYGSAAMTGGADALQPGQAGGVRGLTFLTVAHF